MLATPAGGTGPNPFERAVFRPESTRANAQQPVSPPGFSPSSLDEVRERNISRNVARDELGTSMAEHRTGTKEVMESLQNSFSDDFWPPKFVPSHY
jgi:hypothetical protein